MFLETLANPTQLILQIASLIPIIPISYIISEHYHIKEKLFNKLHTQVLTDEAIFQNINELIIITDRQLKILSVNDSVERTLRQSRLALIDQPLFQVVLLRDKSGKIVTPNKFFPNNDTSAQPKNTEEQFTFVRSPFLKRRVMIRVQSVKDVDNLISQITFIISFNTEPSENGNQLKDILEKTQTKYEALAESIKKKLAATGQNDLEAAMTTLHKMENDMYYAQTLEQFIDPQTATAIDVAQLCKQVMHLEQPLATSLHVNLVFRLKHFGEKDIAPLTVKNFPVKPEQLTGPFFTIYSHVTYLELIIKKLLDIALIMSSKEKNAQILLSIERHTNDTLLLRVEASSPVLTDKDIKNIFVPSNNLYKRSTFSAASGLEGFLLQKISAALNLQLETKYHAASRTIIFSVVLPKATKKPTD